MAERIKHKDIAHEKILVVPPWSHDQIVRYDSLGRQRFRVAHGLDGKFVVMYSGNHSPCHPLTTLLEAARHFASRPEIAFCFIGGGSEFENVKLFARRHELSNIITIPYQPLSALAASLSSADLHVVIMGDSFVGIVHPCKVYNIRVLGIPYLYIGPNPSHVTEMKPFAAAAHGDMDTVVASIRSAAESLGRTLERSVDTVKHGHDYLVSRMVMQLEYLDPAGRSEATRTTWSVESEY
jgi:hypothetical protein